jgi:hypothetical protein
LNQTTSTGEKVFVVKQRSLEDDSNVPEKTSKKNKK